MDERTLTIAYLIDDLSLGGAQKQLSMLARALPSPYKPVVVCLSQHTRPMREVIESAGIEVVAIERRSHAEIRRFREAARVIRTRGADIVHGFLDAANGYAFVCGRTLGKPVVLSLRSDTLRVSGAKRKALEWMLRHADRVLVNSRRGAGFLKDSVGVSETRILHIPNWLDTKTIGPARDLARPGAPLTIGFVGRLVPEKRVDLLVEVFHKLLARIPDARLILMGEGSDRDKIAGLVARLKLGGRVEWVPPSLAVGDTLRRCDVFVMTSALEGLPNAAIEAFALGIPVVSTAVGDMGELIIEGQTGALFEDDDPESMAVTLSRVMTDRALLHNAAAAGPKLVEERFSLSRAVDRITEVYRSLVRR